MPEYLRIHTIDSENFELEKHDLKEGVLDPYQRSRMTANVSNDKKEWLINLIYWSDQEEEMNSSW